MVVHAVTLRFLVLGKKVGVDVKNQAPEHIPEHAGAENLQQGRSDMCKGGVQYI